MCQSATLSNLTIIFNFYVVLFNLVKLIQKEVRSITKKLFTLGISLLVKVKIV